ncbi:carbon starvation protein A [Taurinivorans muris]|uniref:Carbon starvation protein A n=1 Tax=Taurinivorans muris TaxID=2787751 RepID=A0ABY5Y0N2_9BACT|nr:carbon starvation protein A [Desulfovibrionaceae bacterium LT0009]
MPGYVYFLLACAALLVGYLVYGKIVAKIFGEDDNRVTPAISMADGVDYVPMSPIKIWLIQLLNIAGIGPIFGPILGALYGPTALLWIVIGSIFAGATHDYFSGMLSIRYKGTNVPNIVGYNLGNVFKRIMQLFAVILLLLVGVVFMTSPAMLLKNLTSIDMNVWLIIIFVYYLLATILPIDKIIGRLYPIFGAVLLIMAIGMTVMLFVKGYDFYPAAEMTNQFPGDNPLPIYPLIFVTIACGALSGFHATQSPLMSRCLTKESYGRPIFYGAMIGEGFIALIWATVGMTFYQSPAELQAALASGGPANVVNQSALSLMGSIGGILAVLGVIVLPITSGDTAFRAARLTIAEVFNFNQTPSKNRLSIAIPLFIVGAILTQVDFNVIWRYFGWSNQTLACIMLWAGAAYLYRKGRFHWIASIPATFMTSVVVCYICMDKNLGFGIDYTISVYIGIAGALIAIGSFLAFANKNIEGAPTDD